MITAQVVISCSTQEEADRVVRAAELLAADPGTLGRLQSKQAMFQAEVVKANAGLQATLKELSKKQLALGRAQVDLDSVATQERAAKETTKALENRIQTHKDQARSKQRKLDRIAAAEAKRIRAVGGNPRGD